MKNKKDERFKYRFGFSFLREYKRLKEFEKKHTTFQNSTKEEKNQFCLAIKRAYDYAWKVMMDYLKLEGTQCFLPRAVINHYEGRLNTSLWISFIDYFPSFLDNPDEKAMDEFILNYYSTFKKGFDEFYKFFSSKMKEDFPQSPKSHYKYPNRYVLDSYTFDMFISYFKNHPKIHVVRLYGSRAEGTFRRSSDIDLLIGGSFSNEEFIKISSEINAMRHPYFVDLISLNDTDKKGYIKKNIETSIVIYDKKDFM